HRSQVEVLMGISPANVVEQVLVEIGLQGLADIGWNRLGAGAPCARSGISDRPLQSRCCCPRTGPVRPFQRGVSSLLCLAQSSSQPAIVPAAGTAVDEVAKARRVEGRGTDTNQQGQGDDQ